MLRPHRYAHRPTSSERDLDLAIGVAREAPPCSQQLHARFTQVSGVQSPAKVSAPDHVADALRHNVGRILSIWRVLTPRGNGIVDCIDVLQELLKEADEGNTDTGSAIDKTRGQEQLCIWPSQPTDVGLQVIILVGRYLSAIEALQMSSPTLVLPRRAVFLHREVCVCSGFATRVN